MKRPHDHEYSSEAHELGYINIKYERALDAYLNYLEAENKNLKGLVNNSNAMYESMRDERDAALLKGNPCERCAATGTVGNARDGFKQCKDCNGIGML